jgi:hypothetical protein
MEAQAAARKEDFMKYFINAYSDGEVVENRSFDTLPEAEAAAQAASKCLELVDVFDEDGVVICAYEQGCRLDYDDDPVDDFDYDGCYDYDRYDAEEDEDENYADCDCDPFLEVGYDPYTGEYDADL